MGGACFVAYLEEWVDEVGYKGMGEEGLGIREWERRGWVKVGRRCGMIDYS